MWPLRIVHPLALLLVPLAVVAWARWRRRLGGWCTLAAVLCLAVAISRPQWATQRPRVARVYVLDASGSTFLDGPAALDAVRGTMVALAPSDLAGLVVFAATARVALPLTQVALLPSRLELPPELPDRDATDLAGALRLAARQLPPRGFDRQVVVASDGRDTTDDAPAHAALAGDDGIRIFCLPLGPASVADARVASLRAPTHVRRGEPFELTVELATTSPIEAELALRRGDLTLAARKVSLEPGAPCRLVATDRLTEAGLHVYTARLAVADRCKENNLAQAAVHAEGRARVLYLSTTAAPPLARVLRDVATFDLRRVDPTATRLDRAALSRFDCVVVDGASAADVAQAAQAAIRDWVRDAGGGLVTLGGPASYGPGGYRDTPIEQALPVRCARPRQVALLITLDKSGSMAEKAGDRPKIAHARDAVLHTLKHLRPADRLGLVAFDAAPRLLLPMATVPPEQQVREALEAIQPHGPTSLGLALERSLDLLRSPAAPDELRHLILLSDGQVAQLDSAGLRQRFRNAGVTLSVLMTGRQPDALARLRELAGEDFYAVVDPAALPAIFRKAFLKATNRRYVREGRYGVVAATPPALSRGVALAGPLRGYVRLVAKPTAAVEWSTRNDGDPVLARWQYGLGRSAAFATTVGTRWDRELLAPEGVGRLWQQVVRWAARPARTPGFEAEVAERGDAFVLTVRAERDGRFVNGLSLVVHVAPPSGDAFDASLPQTAPGEYRAQLAAPARGIYVLTVVEQGAGRRLTVSVARNCTREWVAFGPDQPRLAAIARNGRGRVLESLGELRTIAPRASVAHVELDWLAIAAALVLFTVSVALGVLRTRRLRL